MTTINRRMNLVIPVDRDDGGKLFVHSTPVGREIFEEYFFEIGKAYAAIFSQGMGVVSGPRVAMQMLKRVAKDGGRMTEVDQGFIREIVRLTNVAAPSDGGWSSIPLHTAIERKVISDDERDSIMGELVFFTLVQLMNKPAQASAMMNVVNGLWGSELTASDFSDYLSSLQISTPAESSGVMPSTLSLPH